MEVDGFLSIKKRRRGRAGLKGFQKNNKYFHKFEIHQTSKVLFCT